MSREALHSQLVIKQKNIQLSLVAKIYGSLSLLVFGFFCGWFLVAIFISDGVSVNLVKSYQDISPLKRLPLLIDRVVSDSSAYVYVKHASIRSELGIPWGKPIGLDKKSKN